MKNRSRFNFFKKEHQPSLQEVMLNTNRLPDTKNASISLYFINHQKAQEAKQLLDAWANDPQGNKFSIDTCTETRPTSYFITLSEIEYNAIMGNDAYEQRVSQVYRRF